MIYIMAGVLTFIFIRRSIQLERLTNAFILASLPVSLYAIAEHFGHDPIPWGGDVTFRSISTLGNAVFLAAYQVMMFFPTFTRMLYCIINAKKDSANLWKGVFYGIIAVLQIISMWYAQSRGPILAFMVGFFTLSVCLVRYRKAFRFGGIARTVIVPWVSCIVTGLSIGCTIVVFMSLVIYKKDATPPFWTFFVFPFMIFCAWGLLRLIQQSLKYFWHASGFIACIVLIFSFSYGFTKPITTPEKGDDSSSSLYVVTATRSAISGHGSMKKRELMWKGYIDALTSDIPAKRITENPDNPVKNDRFAILRPLIGYGQETMGTIFRQHYPKELLRKLSLAETADRAHKRYSRPNSRHRRSRRFCIYFAGKNNSYLWPERHGFFTCYVPTAGNSHIASGALSFSDVRRRS